MRTTAGFRLSRVTTAYSENCSLVLSIPTHVEVHAQGVVHEEIFQKYHNKSHKEEEVAEGVPQQLLEWFDQQVAEPSASYFHETLEQHFAGLKPNASTIDEVTPLPTELPRILMQRQ